MAKLSNRAAEALDVLAGGGRFDYKLERNRRTGREQFHYRLRRKGGQVVTGISGATFRELEAAGFLQGQWGVAHQHQYQHQLRVATGGVSSTTSSPRCGPSRPRTASLAVAARDQAWPPSSTKPRPRPTASPG